MEMENLSLRERLGLTGTIVDAWDAVCMEILLDAKYRRWTDGVRSHLLEREEEGRRLQWDLDVARRHLAGATDDGIVVAHGPFANVIDQVELVCSIEMLRSVLSCA
ncbi:hypothetical protein A2U01_0035075 [Trifolium medium]|uniref:Uncharacterized protein n=1 Tax=Trifolium medium TaxID=97028 RepID=A0A392PPD9_9FABA|nr:hypothetical protein [Trifolium medium]